RYAKAGDRLKNADDLERDIEAVFATAPTAHWVEKMDAAGVPGGPVYSFEQTLADPQVAARQMVVEIDHPKIGMMKTLGLPIKSTGELTEIRKPAPLLGQHTEEVLAELGYGKADIDAMIAGGAAFA